MRHTLKPYLLAGTLALGSLFPTTLAQGVNIPLPTQEQPIKPEANPPGDIPDTQAFVTYTSPDGYKLDVPEGWARSVDAHHVNFSDKYGSVDISTATVQGVLTPQSVRQNQVAKLMASGRAVTVSGVKEVTLPSGKAIRVDYASNSDPNPVTNKQIRLENAEFLYAKDGQLVAVTFSAPYGADNVDQWTTMSQSFGWR